MKVALVHDYLREYGGAERVLEVLHDMFPQAPVYTAYYNPEKLGRNLSDWDIRTSWMQRVPFANKLLSPFRLFAVMMFESFDFRGYDLVISSSSAVYMAKSVITKPETLHISYIHTPPRYLYGYTTAFDYKKRWWTRIGGMLINHIMRPIDFAVSQRPDVMVANSENIRRRIAKFYRRDSVVIYPPVDIEPFLKVKKQVGDYYIYFGRLDPGKRIDLLIEACNQLKAPFKIIGRGKGAEFEKLKKIAGPTIEFLGFVPDDQMIPLIARAKALLLSSEDEDFGITPIEAQAAGTPVVALRAGGYLETVIEGKTGLFFDEPTVASLVEVLQRFDPHRFKEIDCRKNAQCFAKEKFVKEVLQLIQKAKVKGQK